jgi:hypothetical protein
VPRFGSGDQPEPGPSDDHYSRMHLTNRTIL